MDAEGDEAIDDLSAANLVSDPGFEKGTAGFTLLDDDGAGEELVRQSTIKPIAGKASLEVALNTKTANWGCNLDDTKGFTQLRASARVRAEQTTSATLLLCAAVRYANADPITKCVPVMPRSIAGRTALPTLTLTLDATRKGGAVDVWFAKRGGSAVLRYSIDNAVVQATPLAPGADPTPPVTPTGLTLTNDAYGNVTLSWTVEPRSYQMRSVIYRASSPTGPFASVASTFETTYSEAGGAVLNYYYVTTASPTTGSESMPSNTVP